MTSRVAPLAGASVDARLLEIVLDDPELFDLEFGTTVRVIEPPVVSTGVADRRWSRTRWGRSIQRPGDDWLPGSTWIRWARSPPLRCR